MAGDYEIFTIKPDGTGLRRLTHARGNDAHQGWQGRRIMDIETKRVTTIGDGYDNFPLWSPRGDLIMFSRRKDDVLAVG